MHGTRDNDETTAANDDDRLDPREAARLLAQTNRDAKRQFSVSPPWFTAFGGAVILVGYGALWLSTRNQHPYSGPSAGAIVLVYVAVVGSIAASAKLYQRATAGVSGPSVTHDWPQFGAALTVITGGIVALFVGPSAAWLAAGIGLFIAVAGYGAATGQQPAPIVTMHR